MKHEKKKILWERYPEVWAMFEEYNSILQEDQEAWKRLVDRAGELREKYHTEVDKLLQETVRELEKISRRREGK